IFLLVGLVLATAGTASASDELAMPFDCTLDGNHIKLSPTAEKRYAIVGSRDELSVPACGPGSAGSCRSMMAHRFVISCGGAGVPWMRVAAALKRAGAAQAWIEGGRLNVMFTAVAPCIDRPSFALGGPSLQRRVSFTPDCVGQRRETAEHLVLPA